MKTILLIGSIFLATANADVTSERPIKVPVGKDYSKGAILPIRCQRAISQIKKGEAREKIENNFYPDGGLKQVFSKETYVLRDCGTPQIVLKIDLRFMPAGMNEAEYLLAKWVRPQPSGKDKVFSVSKPYWGKPIFD